MPPLFHGRQKQTDYQLQILHKWHKAVSLRPTRYPGTVQLDSKTLYHKIRVKSSPRPPSFALNLLTLEPSSPIWGRLQHAGLAVSLGRAPFITARNHACGAQAVIKTPCRLLTQPWGDAIMCLCARCRRCNTWLSSTPVKLIPSLWLLRQSSGSSSCHRGPVESELSLRHPSTAYKMPVAATQTACGGALGSGDSAA